MWSIWWTEKAIAELHTLPWSTEYLFYPEGVTLLGHTLAPWNGILAIPLGWIFSQVETFNSIVIFHFVASGTTAFWLAWSRSRSYLASLVGGFLFTFSSYHFAHLEGHLNLIALEWLPVFALAWLGLLERPRWSTGLLAAGALFLVTLCDYYYAFYAVLFGALAFVCAVSVAHVRRPLLRPAGLRALACFAVASAVSTGALFGAALLAARAEPWIGAHTPEDFSLDLLAPLLPGGHWRFAGLTSGYWAELPGNVHESSVHLGFATLLVLLFAVFAGERKRSLDDRVWFASLGVFGVLALGPVLQVWGQPWELSRGLMPYRWLEVLLPPLRLTGVPVRFIVLVLLAACVLVARYLPSMLRATRWPRLAAFLFVGLLALDLLPRAVTTSQPWVPGYIQLLQKLDGEGSVLDLANPPTVGMYYQTVHGKPLALGLISRLPSSRRERAKDLGQAWVERDLPALRRMGVRFVIVDPARLPRGERVLPGAQRVVTRRRGLVYRLD